MGRCPGGVKPARVRGGGVGVVWILESGAPAGSYRMTRKVLSQRVFDSALKPEAVSGAAPGAPALPFKPPVVDGAIDQ